jgi:hypothetical protein
VDTPPAKTKKPRKNLTVKERKFVRVLAETGNQTQAIIAAGYDTVCPGAMGSRVAKKANIREALLQYLDRMDISKKMSRNLEIGLDSTLDPSDENFDTRMNTVLKVQDQIARLAGLEAPKRSERAVGHFDATALLPRGDTVKSESVAESVTASTVEAVDCVVPTPPKPGT